MWAGGGENRVGVWSGKGFATSAALCAMASVMNRSGDRPASAASPVIDRAAVKARRVMIKVGSRIGGSSARYVPTLPFASLKRPVWQWLAAAMRAGESVNFA